MITDRTESVVLLLRRTSAANNGHRDEGSRAHFLIRALSACLFVCSLLSDCRRVRRCVAFAFCGLAADFASVRLPRTLAGSGSIQHGLADRLSLVRSFRKYISVKRVSFARIKMLDRSGRLIGGDNDRPWLLCMYGR